MRSMFRAALFALSAATAMILAPAAAGDPPPVDAPAGKTVQVSGAGELVFLRGDGGSVDIHGESENVVLYGTFSGVYVGGNRNIVNVESAREISISGVENEVAAVAATRISVSGISNTVSHGNEVRVDVSGIKNSARRTDPKTVSYAIEAALRHHIDADQSDVSNAEITDLITSIKAKHGWDVSVKVYDTITGHKNTKEWLEGLTQACDPDLTHPHGDTCDVPSNAVILVIVKDFNGKHTSNILYGYNVYDYALTIAYASEHLESQVSAGMYRDGVLSALHDLENARTDTAGVMRALATAAAVGIFVVGGSFIANSVLMREGADTRTRSSTSSGLRNVTPPTPKKVDYSPRVAEIKRAAEQLTQEWFDYEMNPEDYWLRKPRLRDASAREVIAYHSAMDDLNTFIDGNLRAPKRVTEDTVIRGEKMADAAMSAWDAANRYAERMGVFDLPPREKTALRRIREMTNQLTDESTPPEMRENIIDKIKTEMDRLVTVPTTMKVIRNMPEVMSARIFEQIEA